MRNLPRLKPTDFEALYEYLKALSGAYARQGTIDDFKRDANDNFGVGMSEENGAHWLTRDAVVYLLQPNPYLCSTMVPDAKTIEAVEADDGSGSADVEYPLPGFYADMFEVDGGRIKLKSLTPDQRKKFRKLRLADYMTQRCF